MSPAQDPMPAVITGAPAHEGAAAAVACRRGALARAGLIRVTCQLVRPQVGIFRNPYFFRSAWAVLLVHTNPEAPNSGSRLTPPTGLVAPGMWSAVLGSNGTTSKTVRWKVEGKAELITVLPPVPVVAATPLIFLSTMVPWVLQPNRFWVPLGVQRSPVPFGVQVALKHVAEWNRSAMYLPMENGKMAFGSLRTGLTPWFSSRVSFTLDTQAPGVATPMAPRKNARVPDWDCGMNAWIGAFLPPTWLQLVVVQL